MKTKRCINIKKTLIILTVFACTKVDAQVKIACCHIKQTIPVFKSDTNFKLSFLYRVLITKKILKPINQSGAPLEIRITIPGDDMKSETRIIKCDQNRIVVTDYQLDIQSSTTSGFKNLKNIGRENPGDLLSNWLNVTDLSNNYKSYNWNAFFKGLISNHLFDIPGGSDFINSVRNATSPDNYPQGSEHSGIIIEIKIGNRYRNLRYDGVYSDKKTNNIGIVKYKNALMDLIFKVFQQKQ